MITEAVIGPIPEVVCRPGAGCSAWVRSWFMLSAINQAQAA